MVTVLGIPQKPQISGYSGPLREGGVAVLTCVSSGSKPAAQLRWNKGEKLLTGQPLEVSKDANGKTFTVTSQVEITVGKEDDGANVSCTVDHSSLQISEKSALQRLSVYSLRDLRIQLENSTANELSISIDNTTLADEGEYTCTIFTRPVRTAKAMVTVLGMSWW
ncbi:PREDICTED: cell adhesion molecule 3-like [Thamnophis sirtalis]|uniref:Cell adhesion molecule 3-like n=1 Tax=Thamnophis sirtalis TaxID=35019 RepID=A0A6I9X7Z3_9SAUR|nr:PREDICTED: cell adhesion molecule 3-like [Thamnophis sirtalis]